MDNSKELVISTSSFRINERIRARFLRPKNGRIELAIIISDEASAEDLRSAWATIDRLRTRLRRFQGSDMQRVYPALVYNYAEMNARGWSYGLIAMDINFDCTVNLCRAADQLPDLNQPILDASGLSQAIVLLRAVRMKDEDILFWVLPALEEIKAGRAPWPLNAGPVDAQRIRDTLRQWEKEQQTEKVVIKCPPQHNESKDAKALSGANRLHHQQAKELLRSTYPESFPKYEQLLRETISRTGFAGAVHILR